MCSIFEDNVSNDRGISPTFYTTKLKNHLQEWMSYHLTKLRYIYVQLFNVEIKIQNSIEEHPRMANPHHHNWWILEANFTVGKTWDGSKENSNFASLGGLRIWNAVNFL